jgi:hypothetical protein
MSAPAPLSPFPPVLTPGGPVPAPATYWDDFVTGGSATATGPKFSSTADAAEWLTTLITSAVPKVEDNANFKAVTPFGAGGVVRIVNGATNNDSVSMQLNGEPFVAIRKKSIVFEARVATSAIAGTLLAVGLGKTETAILAAGGQTLTATDFIGFVVRGTSGLILPVVKGANTETLPPILNGVTAPALVNNQWATLRFEIQPTGNTTHMVYFYVDGLLVAKHNSETAALPLDASQGTPIGLTPSYSQKTQGSAANNGFIDYILAVAQR